MLTSVGSVPVATEVDGKLPWKASASVHMEQQLLQKLFWLWLQAGVMRIWCGVIRSAVVAQLRAACCTLGGIGACSAVKKVSSTPSTPLLKVLS